MSNHHYIKGLRRRAARRGLGRKSGNIAALFEAQERETGAQTRLRVRAAVAAEKRIKKASALEKMVAQDKRRKSKLQ